MGRWNFSNDCVKNVFVYRRGVSTMFCINPSSNLKTPDLLTEDIHAVLEERAGDDGRHDEED